MADIIPFRGWRYHERFSKEIDALTSPLFDVVSDRQRAALYANPYNSIHLSVPLGERPYEHALQTLKAWEENHILEQDPQPAIYVYYQYFCLPGEHIERCRKGFICYIRATPYEEKVVLRHENTIPNAVNDRIELLEKTLLHVSPTHGLYEDEAEELERYMDQAIGQPIYETEDYQGVRDVLAMITDPAVIARFVEKLKGQQVILADGHHRYESSLVLRQRKIAEGQPAQGNQGYQYHMMYLTNARQDGLKILPTHRLLSGVAAKLEAPGFFGELESFFHIREIEDPSTLNEVIAGKKWAFGLVAKNWACKVRLREEVYPQLAWQFPEEVKALDLTVMHYFLIERLLGIPGRIQRRAEQLSFERNFSQCLQKVAGGQADLAIITNEVEMSQVRAVCATGYTMPQKSTYFYPKALCGFVFGSIAENEF